MGCYRQGCRLPAGQQLQNDTCHRDRSLYESLSLIPGWPEQDMGGNRQGYIPDKNNRLERVKLLKQPFGEVMSVAADKHGWLYFGGYNYGLLAYHEKSGKTKLFTSA